MIIYDLSCDNHHRFEGWFRSAVDFDRQRETRLIACPQCDSKEIQRIPSAVAIAQGGSLQEKRHPDETTASMPASNQAKTLYRQLLQTMIAHSEDVGSAFAEEARKIHYNEAPVRPIRGQTTEDERESLQEEGIPVLYLPTPKDDDLH